MTQGIIRKRLTKQGGFSLVEMIMLLIIVSIVLAVTMQSMTVAVDDIRQTRTEREMAMLARSIVGDPSVTVDGVRSDFGFVGDVGALPTSLDALTTNPGYATWDGPYIEDGFDAASSLQDEWGAAYTFDGSAISSTGSGTTITQTVASNPAHYLYNNYSGVVKDLLHRNPGADFLDSVEIVVVYPDGAGSTTTRTEHPDALGSFTLDSLPAGVHLLKVIYTPDADTLRRYITVVPRQPSTAEQFLFSEAYFDAGGSTPPTPTGTDTLLLRPMANGDMTNLGVAGAGTNWQAVSEASSDGDGSTVTRNSSSWATDTYQLDDPGVSSGTISSITVYCVARHTNSGAVKLVIRYGGSSESGSEQSIGGSFETYSETWSTSPFTGSAWTWPEIVSLQAGLELKGMNPAKPGKCTQLWVEVEYES